MPPEDLGPHVLEPDLGDVPLREDDDRRALRLAGDVGDREVLIDDALARVDEDERDVRALRGLERAELRVVLDALTLLALPAQARPCRRGRRSSRRGGAPCRSSRASFPGTSETMTRSRPSERVQERRLADVRPAEDRDPDRLLADRPLAVPGQAARRSRRGGRPSRGRGAPRSGSGRRGRDGGTRAPRGRGAGRRACSRARARAAATRAGSPRAPRRPASRPLSRRRRRARGPPPRPPARACAAICGPNGPVSARSTPPVSMRRNVVPDHSQRSSLRSRVTPGVSWTTAVRVAVRRLISVDLPTFGKPTIATVPAISTSVGHVGHDGGVASRGRPSSWTPASHSQSFLISRSISTDASL